MCDVMCDANDMCDVMCDPNDTRGVCNVLSLWHSANLMRSKCVYDIAGQTLSNVFGWTGI